MLTITAIIIDVLLAAYCIYLALQIKNMKRQLKFDEIVIAEQENNLQELSVCYAKSLKELTIRDTVEQMEKEKKGTVHNYPKRIRSKK